MSKQFAIGLLLCSIIVLASTNSCPSYNGNDLLQSGTSYIMQEKMQSWEEPSEVTLSTLSKLLSILWSPHGVWISPWLLQQSEIITHCPTTATTTTLRLAGKELPTQSYTNLSWIMICHGHQSNCHIWPAGEMMWLLATSKLPSTPGALHLQMSTTLIRK